MGNIPVKLMLMKKLIVILLLFLQQVAFAQGFDKEWYYSRPNPSVHWSNLFTEVISPETESAVISFDRINVYYRPTSTSYHDWQISMELENTSERAVYVNFPKATAIVDGLSAHLYYRRRHVPDNDMTAFAFELLPHTFSYQIFVQPNVYLDSKELRREAKKYGVNSEKSIHYVTFNLPITDAETMETEIYKIEFEVKWVDKKFLKENDYCNPKIGVSRGYHFPRAAYEALQNRPIPEDD